jgi:hypothetical protein
MANYFGICPRLDGTCTRSFAIYTTLPAGFERWLGGASLPDVGGPPVKNPLIQTACSHVFQKTAMTPSFCVECGSQLVFVPETASLGICECGCEYSAGDPKNAFCSCCGRPIDIDERTRDNFERTRSIQALLNLVPQFQTYGYLAES